MGRFLIDRPPKHTTVRTPHVSSNLALQYRWIQQAIVRAEAHLALVVSDLRDRLLPTLCGTLALHEGDRWSSLVVEPRSGRKRPMKQITEDGVLDPALVR